MGTSRPRPRRGPIAALQAGDLLDTDLTERTINVHLSECEIEARLATLPPFEPRVQSKWLRQYSDFVTSADQGAVLADV